MLITFKWSDGKTYEFKVSEDYGALKMFELWDAIHKNPNLGKKPDKFYEFDIEEVKDA